MGLFSLQTRAMASAGILITPGPDIIILYDLLLRQFCVDKRCFLCVLGLHQGRH